MGAGISDDRIGLITFTRCGAAAKVLQRKAGLKKRVLELGSNSLVIVLSDAAVQSCVLGACSASEQNCVGVKQMFVEEAHYNLFLKKCVAQTAALKIGSLSQRVLP